MSVADVGTTGGGGGPVGDAAAFVPAPPIAGAGADGALSAAPPIAGAGVAAALSESELSAVSKDGVKVAVTVGRLESMYEVGKPIGKGKFSTVYKAIRRSDGIPVALKQIAIFDMMDEKSREKCLKEIKLVQSLNHENIIRYLDGFIENKQLILVFEYAEAGDLKRQLRKAREREARFDERVIWKYFSQIADAVAHIHACRIMHRDLKPANIFLTLNGTVKVGDLGLGRALSENTLEAHSKVGTPLYMSPEVLKGRGYEWSSDVWSLGCILYELAMLRSPFKEEGLNLYGLFQKITQGAYSPIAEVYSPALRSLVDSMLQQDPAARPDINEVCRVAAEMRDKTAKARAAMLAAQTVAPATATTDVSFGSPVAADREEGAAAAVGADREAPAPTNPPVLAAAMPVLASARLPDSAAEVLPVGAAAAAAVQPPARPAPTLDVIPPLDRPAEQLEAVGVDTPTGRIFVTAASAVLVDTPVRGNDEAAAACTDPRSRPPQASSLRHPSIGGFGMTDTPPLEPAASSRPASGKPVSAKFRHSGGSESKVLRASSGNADAIEHPKLQPPIVASVQSAPASPLLAELPSRVRAHSEVSFLGDADERTAAVNGPAGGDGGSGATAGGRADLRTAGAAATAEAISATGHIRGPMHREGSVAAVPAASASAAGSNVPKSAASGMAAAKPPRWTSPPSSAGSLRPGSAGVPAAVAVPASVAAAVQAYKVSPTNLTAAGSNAGLLPAATTAAATFRSRGTSAPASAYIAASAAAAAAAAAAVVGESAGAVTGRTSLIRGSSAGSVLHGRESSPGVPPPHTPLTADAAIALAHGSTEHGSALVSDLLRVLQLQRWRSVGYGVPVGDGSDDAAAERVMSDRFYLSAAAKEDAGYMASKADRLPGFIRVCRWVLFAGCDAPRAQSAPLVASARLLQLLRERCSTAFIGLVSGSVPPSIGIVDLLGALAAADVAATAGGVGLPPVPIGSADTAGAAAYVQGTGANPLSLLVWLCWLSLSAFGWWSTVGAASPGASMLEAEDADHIDGGGDSVGGDFVDDGEDDCSEIDLLTTENAAGGRASGADDLNSSTPAPASEPTFLGNDVQLDHSDAAHSVADDAVRSTSSRILPVSKGGALDASQEGTAAWAAELARSKAKLAAVDRVVAARVEGSLSVVASVDRAEPGSSNSASRIAAAAAGAYFASNAGGGWRERLAAGSAGARAVAGSVEPSVIQGTATMMGGPIRALRSLRAAWRVDLDSITSGEGRLNGGGGGGAQQRAAPGEPDARGLATMYRACAATAADLAERLAAAQARAVSLSSAMAAACDEGDALEEALADATAGAQGTERLQRLRGALAALRRQCRGMDVELGIASAQLLLRQRNSAEADRAAAKAGRTRAAVMSTEEDEEDGH